MPSFFSLRCQAISFTLKTLFFCASSLSSYERYAVSIPFRTILITGGSGSLGQALTRFLLSLSSDIAIRIFSRGEHRQADMHARFQSPQIRYLIGDVRDYQRVMLACHGADLVIHAAALKRQDALEYNVYEGVQTNILGTYNVLRACAEAAVQRCITISSDKAVFPVTLYGAP